MDIVLKNQRKESILQDILPYLAPDIYKLIAPHSLQLGSSLEEIRLRCNQPIVLRTTDQELTITRQGKLDSKLAGGYRVKTEDLSRTIASISDNSFYAFEEEIRRGFITIPGGHRVGLAGQMVIRDNQVHNISSFSSIAIRMARQIKGCASSLLPQLVHKGRVNNTLVVSPPRCGKTTLLRDLTRILSSGDDHIPGCNITVVDERSEIAGCYHGIPQMDIGPRTDVLDACPKALGMMMAIRSLSPDILVTDELGRKEDLYAVRECINAGVNIIASVHAGSIEEIQRRDILQDPLSQGIFQSIVILSRRHGPGTVEEIIRWEEE